jgi:hypothetical protein
MIINGKPEETRYNKTERYIQIDETYVTTDIFFLSTTKY